MYLLWIEPKYRGSGYGKLLTEKRIEWALKHSSDDYIYLDTYDAKDYHLKMGWEIIDVISDEQIIMKRKIR